MDKNDIRKQWERNSWNTKMRIIIHGIKLLLRGKKPKNKLSAFISIIISKDGNNLKFWVMKSNSLCTQLRISCYILEIFKAANDQSMTMQWWQQHKETSLDNATKNFFKG